MCGLTPADTLRVENMMRYEKLSATGCSEKKIRKSDRERYSFLARTFGRERAKERPLRRVPMDGQVRYFPARWTLSRLLWCHVPEEMRRIC